MKRILVTGANKGIGLATVEAILQEQPDCLVLLGSRDIQRGNVARDSLLAINSEWSERVEVLEIDVGSDKSVLDAAASIANRYGRDPAPLSGLVNNAGIASGALNDILNINVYGIHRVCTSFIPLLATAGRVVNITSAAGPNFVAACNAKQQRFFLDSEITWNELDAFMQQCIKFNAEDFAKNGMGDSGSYGLSKACANVYTLVLARSNPDLVINACTPGFIETDLTLEMIQGLNKSPKEMGMKQPSDGARVSQFLLFGEPEGTGHYYGSDSLRSPLDCYRAPGTAAYTGE